MSDDLGTPEDPEPFDPAATGPEDGFAPLVSDRGDADAGPTDSVDSVPADSAPADPAPARDERTGVPAADSALDRLLDLDTAPLEEHVEIFDDVHRRLHEGLAELDDEQ